MMMMRMLPIVLTLFFSRWRVAPLCQPTFDVRTMHCTAGAMRPYRLGWTCTTWFLAWFLRICWSAPLLWSSTGGGWRAMFADVGYVNVFRQAGLLTANATQFTSVVCVHMIIIIIIIWLICLIAPFFISFHHHHHPHHHHDHHQSLLFIRTGHRVRGLVVLHPTLLFRRLLQQNRLGR